jgi:hypothetical protein
MISTRNLAGLPYIYYLKRLCQSLAMLDAILSPEWEYRYYSFNSKWAPGEMMASMRNGSGDDYFALFTLQGAILKGFAQEAPMSPYAHNPPRIWPGMLDSVPPAFAGFLTEPAFNIGDTTFCIWRQYQDADWQRGTVAFPAGTDPDGSADLLSCLDGDPQTYQQWASDYYDHVVDLDAVAHIYAHRPLIPRILAILNPDLGLEDLAEDIGEIGYPARVTG